MKNVLTTFAVVIVAIALYLGASYLIGAVHTQQQVNQISNAAKTKTAEPIISTETARAEFMQGCDTGEYYLQNEYCQCMWNKLATDFGVNTLINDGLSLNQEEVEVKYYRQINYCLTTVYENIEL
jgi:hypothetical protein